MLKTHKKVSSFVSRKIGMISSRPGSINHQIMNFKFTPHQTNYIPFHHSTFQSEIPLLEKVGEQLFLVRRSMWKVIVIYNESYYDVIFEDDFEELFGDLWIGDPSNQTPLRNQYHVLRLDFSIESSSENIQQALYNSINGQIVAFL